MKVAIATDGVFPEAMGGMQRHSRLLAEHLARTGEVELTVLHPHPVGLFKTSTCGSFGGTAIGWVKRWKQ